MAVLCIVFQAPAAPQGGSAAQAALNGLVPSADFGSFPLYFAANRGQAADGVLFEARTGRYRLELTARGLDFYSECGVSRMRFKGSRPDARIGAADPAAYRVNYFQGSRPDEWLTDIPTSEAVIYEGLYPDIDLKVYGAERQVEYDWLVRSGADPAAVAFSFEAAGDVLIDADGNLVVGHGSGEIVHRAPSAYQDIDGRRVAIEASFEARSGGTYGFRVGRYDRSRDLVIDPYVIGYSTYVGTDTKDLATAIGVDGEGAVYIAGMKYEMPYKTPPLGPFDRSDVFVTKIAPDGLSLVYTSYFPVGKTFKGWVKPDLAVDAAGNAYLVGVTGSNKFPVKNAFQSEFQGGNDDGFIVKLAPTGKTLVFSSYLGGGDSDGATGVAVDAKGAVYIAGVTRSADFPLARPFQNKPGSLLYKDDSFLTKLAPSGRNLVFSTYLGGSNIDQAEDVALDAAGSAYVVGSTESTDFPLAEPLQLKHQGMRDFFVTKFAPDGRSLSYSTYLGGSSEDEAYSVAVDGKGCAIVAGCTYGKFRLKNAFQTVRKGMAEAVIAKLAPTGKGLVFSSYLGSMDVDYAYGVAVRADGVIAVAGMTKSLGFPLMEAVQKGRRGGQDAFLTLIPAKGGSLLFSTYLGGGLADNGQAVIFDAEGRILVTGYTNSLNFPFKDGVQDEFAGGGWDSFVTRYQVK
ncbi:MAG: SBBP repeat-containing protein [Candidatus Aminicenantes bacterium]|nr:SBBP repeat-containing protein [Candidatus Aminicenantes bacterium]